MNVFDQQTAVHASTIHEIRFIEHMRDTERPTAPLSKMRLHPRLLAIPYEELDERLIVFLDRHARIVAMGFPHGDSTVLMERRENGMVLPISIGQCIVEESLFKFIGCIAVMNGENAWDPVKNMTILGTLHDMAIKEREWAAEEEQR